MGSQRGFCNSFVKGVFTGVQFIVWLSAVARMGVGIWLVAGSFTLDFLEPADYKTLGQVAIVLGAFVFLMSFLGGMGAFYDSSCMLGTYMAFHAVVIAAQIGLGIYLAATKNDIKDRLRGEMADMIKTKYQKNDTKGHIDNVQKRWECCGSAGPADYANSTWVKELVQKNNTNQKIPESCCRPNAIKTDCIQMKSPGAGNSTTAYYSKGCWEAACEEVMEHKVPFVVSASVVGVLQVASLVCAAVFLRQLTSDYHQY